LSGRQGGDFNRKLYFVWQARWVFEKETLFFLQAKWGFEQESLFCLAGKVGILSGRQGGDLNRKLYFVWQARQGGDLNRKLYFVWQARQGGDLNRKLYFVRQERRDLNRKPFFCLACKTGILMECPYFKVFL
jgi:hypothetical protein